MVRVLEGQTEADVDETVGPVEGERRSELLDKAAVVGGRHLGRRTRAVERDPFVSVDGKGPAGVVEHRGGSSDVVEVRVGDRRKRAIRHGAQMRDGGAHLFDALAGVDCHDAVGRVDEHLVRQAITNDHPDPGSYGVNRLDVSRTVRDVIAVTDPTAGIGDRV